MANYIILGKFTEEGVKNIKDLRQFVSQNQELGKRLGMKANGWYMTMGQYDFVVLVEGPDDETAVAQVMTVAGRGRSRTETLRAFSLDEVDAIIQKVG